MRSLEIHVLVLVLFCALVRMTVGSVPSQSLELQWFSTPPDLCGQSLSFRDHRFYLAFWSCGGSNTVARGPYVQLGCTVYLDDEYSGKQLVYSLSDLGNKPTLKPIGQLKSIKRWTLDPLTFRGRLQPSPTKVPLSDLPVAICGVVCGMDKQEVKRTLGHPPDVRGPYWGYADGLRIRFGADNRVIGVAGNQLWQGDHWVNLEDREQVVQLFGSRLVFPDGRHRGIAAQFGLTILFQYAKKDEDCSIGELQMGDIPNPGFISNDSGEWPSAEVLEENEREMD